MMDAENLIDNPYERQVQGETEEQIEKRKVNAVGQEEATKETSSSSIHIDENGNKQNDEELNLGDTSHYNVKERNALFQRGLDFEKEKQEDKGLQCYLGCIKGLTQKTKFVLLPQCLHSIADIYRDKGDYQNAIHFAQAEKLFYESALIDSSILQEKLEEVSSAESSDVPQDLNDLNVDSLRAEEYEHLAQLCLDKHQSQLALEYAGKCTKLRQRIYGDNHEKTQTSLNMFAEIYAEVGKSQYTDSVALLAEPPTSSDVPPEGAPKMEDPSTPNGSEPVSILRQRSVLDIANTTTETDQEKKRVRFHKSVEDSVKLREKEEFASVTITLIVLSVLFLILATMGMWLYCSISRASMCKTLTSHLHQWLKMLQFTIHKTL